MNYTVSKVMFCISHDITRYRQTQHRWGLQVNDNYMGSGIKRKKNDVVIINRPKSKGGSGGEQGQPENEDLNTVCPPTFRVRLTPPKPLLEGSPVYIEKEDIIQSGQKVGTLTKSQALTVYKCLEYGFRYPGKVITEAKNQYGVFTRT